MDRLIFIGLGTLAMLVLSLLSADKYKIPLWKSIVLPVLLTFCGVLGAMLLSYVESGGIWGGISFYGSVLLIPILMVLVSFAIKLPYAKIMDMSAPQVCAMLAVMKVHCFVMGCCGGVYYYSEWLQRSFVFPSQIVEVVVAICIMVVLLLLSRGDMFKDRQYGVFLLIYGVIRFCLNFFRGGITPFLWIIPAGHLWSIVSVLIGIGWLIIVTKKNRETLDDSTVKLDDECKVPNEGKEFLDGT